MSVLSSVLGAANALVNWFLPKESKRALSDTRVETSFIFLHVFGPLMGQVIGLFLFYADPNPGIEVLVERRSATGLSGWAAYSYGRATQTDPARGETYWSDFDQRHTLNLFGIYRFSPTTSVGGTFRAGSNFPLPGYFERRAPDVIVGGARNQVRLPAYVRLDLRADRQFHYLGRRLTPFIELLNVFDRVNTGRADGRVNHLTGEAQGFTEPLMRRRVTAGIVIDF